MVEAGHRLVADGLHVDHLCLVMGTSLGDMHTWMWGEQYPDMMDAPMPLASLPAPITPTSLLSVGGGKFEFGFCRERSRFSGVGALTRWVALKRGSLQMVAMIQVLAAD